jgi:hypothetical protein
MVQVKKRWLPQSSRRLIQEDFTFGAGRGNRTPTGLLAPADFKSAASANFAIPALVEVLDFTV